VPVRGPLARLLWWTAAVSVGVLAVVGGLALRGPGLVAVGLAGTLAACTAVGIARETPGPARRSMLEVAVQTAAWTIGVLLSLGGLAALAGGSVALLVGVAALTGWLLRRMLRFDGKTTRPAPRGAAAFPTPGVEVLLLPVPPEEGSAPSTVASVETAALGREWVRTSAALGRRLPPSERAALVRRREETLDELERRDPAGFARWLADGASPESDPAAYVRDRRVEGDQAAGTDAA
jgi:hypothetical protein